MAKVTLEYQIPILVEVDTDNPTVPPVPYISDGDITFQYRGFRRIDPEESDPEATAELVRKARTLVEKTWDRVLADDLSRVIRLVSTLPSNRYLILAEPPGDYSPEEMAALDELLREANTPEEETPF